MTRVRGATALGFLLVIASACSVTHRSGDFTCDDRTRCADDRVCVDGLCILPDPPGDASSCPPACTSCLPGSKTCTIDCDRNGGCRDAVTCPDGWDCDVLCSNAGSCRNGVTCPGDTSCTVTCSGSQSCQGVTCGTGACRVDCIGSQSCRDVRCGPACSCDVTCTGSSSCPNLSCAQGCTLPVGTGCTSLAAGCDRCP